MAILTFAPSSKATEGIDLYYYFFESLFQIDRAKSASADLISIFNDFYNYRSGEILFTQVNFTGTFAFGPLNTVSGNLSDITATVGEDLLLTVTDIDLDMGNVWSLGNNVAPYIFSGDDLMSGSDGNDGLVGYSGADELHGGGGNDYLEGGAGRDVIIGNLGNDSLSGGDGQDRLFGGKDNDYLYGGARKDYLNGASGVDYLNGGRGSDELHGGAGKDRMYGDAGEDTLFGGRGNDYLAGGRGDDLLTGGVGADQFVFYEFNRSDRSGADIISDFTTEDSILLNYNPAKDMLDIKQVGNDVEISLHQNLITVLDSTLTDVEGAIVQL